MSEPLTDEGAQELLSEPLTVKELSSYWLNPINDEGQELLAEPFNELRSYWLNHKPMKLRSYWLIHKPTKELRNYWLNPINR